VASAPAPAWGAWDSSGAWTAADAVDAIIHNHARMMAIQGQNLFEALVWIMEQVPYHLDSYDELGILPYGCKSHLYLCT
jgi:hypothetical protein